MSEKAEAVLSPAEELSAGGKRTVPLVWCRRLVQFASLAVIGEWSFYGIFRCPFIVPYISCENCPVITCPGRLLTTFRAFWLLIPVSALIFGRAFCGWICPGGLANQLVSLLAPVKLRTRNAFTRIAPFFKYLGLAVALYVLLVMEQPREAVPIRIGSFFSSVELTFEYANPVWLIRTFFVLGFLVLGLLLANAWCRFACPSGGLLEALKHFSFLKVYKTERCDDCNRCLKACEMGTRPSEPNCTNCCDCLSVCPQNAIRIGPPRRKV